MVSNFPIIFSCPRKFYSPVDLLLFQQPPLFQIKTIPKFNIEPKVFQQDQRQLGTTLEPLWEHFGTSTLRHLVLGQLWGNFEVKLLPLGNMLRAALRQLWCKFETFLGPHGDYLVATGRASLCSVGSILPCLASTESCIFDHLSPHTLLDHFNYPPGLNSQLVPWMNDGEVWKETKLESECNNENII